jgi:deferrochelatase/peroxidase EfeB
MTISRRKFIAMGAGAAGVAAAGGGVALAVGGDDNERAASHGVVPFRGVHQAGIATEQQDRLLFAAFDLTSSKRDDVASMLQAWTTAADRLTRGLDVGGPLHEAAPPADTGEATGLDPAQLTLTFGFGPGLFQEGGAGADRYGVAGRRPAPLAALPLFKRDNLDPARSDGDLCVQACGNDPQVLYHAVRNLTRLGRGTVRLRWTQQGFGRTSATTPSQLTPRNLMGFKDGTNNLRAGSRQVDEQVWVARGDDPAWMRGGSYLVARRIRIHIEVWDRSALSDQEATIGRAKVSGAPLGSAKEFDLVDLTHKGADGEATIPPDAHIRLANQAANGISFLRRGYSFTDGVDPATGQLDAGLFFIAYQRDPRHQFVPVQAKLAKEDALNEYIEHVASAVFAVPPGAPPGGWIGETLFE